ncbi:BMP family ABC transporter substrate-binding protein [Spirochaeta isovalerica]|uniref:Basic membrane lipoprotein Med (Substrate-binding protein (PBP1-ABC) superfamily) n=1 Tax=Spirochaeta isovalerica TaxID=150 RepID=A0A841R6U9_9SPIO|nr:BMP family ABC transporter substrate-binding protein [Spirochaeta isovalerica]MBB6478709.1 basic membrane lipoprotein Med (substrate-binding protein (PBP1-ABC) superfamily) [Spirochaeta isovalerica]
MKKTIPLFFSLFLFISCGQIKSVVIVDTWWDEAYSGLANLKKEAFWAGLKAFQPVSVIEMDSEESAYNFLNSLMEKQNELTVILSPVFNSYTKNWVFDEKKINYIILNGFYDDPADNVIAVYSSREEVYREAGMKAARYSESHSNCSVAAVFYNGTEARRSERDSFIQGFNEAGVSGKLLVSDQQTYAGGEKLKSFISSAPEKDVGLFFFSASSLNPFCFEQAQTLSIPISGENLNSSGLHSELIEFSIDDDMVRIVKTALKMGLDGEVENDLPVFPLLKEKGIHF